MRFQVLAVLLAAAFAAVYTVEGFVFRNYNLDEFQVAAGYLKDRDPSLFASDFIWSRPEMIRNLHVSVRGLMRATDWLTFGAFEEPIDLFLVWLPVCMMLFFTGIYLLCAHFTANRWAGLLVACSFLIVRRTVWDWWGLGPTFTMSARGTVLSLLPLGLWGFFQFEGNPRRLALWFLGWGVVSNLHPLSGWGFVELLGITLLIVDRFHRRAWLKVMIMAAATWIGSAPFIWIWSHVAAVPEALRASPEILKPFWDDFGGISPPPRRYVLNLIEDLAIPLALSVAGLIVWNRWKRPGDPQSMRLLYTFPLIVIGMTALVMSSGWVLRKAGVALPVMVPEHSRSEKFVYLTLPVWMAFAFAGWFRWRAASGAVVRWLPPVALVLLSFSINPPGHKLARHLLCKGDLWPEAAAEKLALRAREDAADLELARWARSNTRPDALFYFDSYEFRYYARRSLVFCWFDRPCVAYRPTRDLEEWVRRRDRVKPLKDSGDSEGMLAAARDYKADYLVLLNQWKSVHQYPVWSNGKYSVFRIR